MHSYTHTLIHLYPQHGMSAAHVAARRGEVGVLRVLHRDLQVDVLAEDFDGRSPLQHLPRVALLGNEEGTAAAREFLMSLSQVE